MKNFISIVAAFDEKNGVGINNTLPWKLQKDLIRFNSITYGFPIVMGRKTFDSIGKPLPDRTNIILSRDKNWAAEIRNKYPEVSVLFSWEDVLLWVNEHNPGKIFIIGGPQIWNLALPYVDQLLLTHVKGEYNCDAFFPEIKLEEWFKTDEIEYNEMSFVNYIKNKKNTESNKKNIELVNIQQFMEINKSKHLDDNEKILYAKVKKDSLLLIEELKSKAFIKNKDLVFYSSETDEVKKSLEIRWFKERFPMI
jgi:dihydrofolate reductase